MTQEELKTHHDNCEAAKDNLTLKGFTGPWNNELNRLNWKAHGLDCMLVRNPVMLNWCGYVGISSDHPDFNRDYGDLEELNVHGGLTYANLCQGNICHLSDDNGEPTYWLGFDCGHFDDIAPLMLEYRHLKDWPKYSPETYKTEQYAKLETQNLALQLSKRRK